MNNQRSGSFLCKKWTLFTLTLIQIIGSIVLAAVASAVIDSVARTYPEYYTQDVKNVFKGMFIAAAVINILFNLLGLMGAYKEHFCLTMTYAVLMTLVSFGGISMAVKASAYWYSTVLSFAITGLAYALARDIHLQRSQLFATPVILGQPAQSTVVQISPGYSGHSYGAPQQYSGQQYSGQQYGDQQYANRQPGWQPPPAYNADPYNKNPSYPN